MACMVLRRAPMRRDGPRAPMSNMVRCNALPGGRSLGTRVVVADDVEDLRWLLRAVLNADGRFDIVGEAADGRQAVDVVGLTHPDVVLLDLRMPTMDGLEAAAEIHDVSPATKVVLLSAVEERAVAAAAQQVGITAFIQKGCTATQISETVALTAER